MYAERRMYGMYLSSDLVRDLSYRQRTVMIKNKLQQNLFMAKVNMNGEQADIV